MPLQGAEFLDLLRNFRICWLGGRFGGGKTAFAERLGVEFVDRGWADHIVGNFPSVLHTDISRIECKDCFIVLDEAGVWLDDREFDKVTAFLRKRNMTVVLASVLPVSLRAKTLNVQRTFNGHRLGLNFWRYSALLDYMRVKLTVSIIWRNPREIYGLYDTGYVAMDDGGIVKWVVDSFNEGRQNAIEIPSKGSRKARKADTAQDRGDSLAWGGIQGVESGRRLAGEVSEAADKMEAAVSELNRAARRGRRR